MTGKKNQLANFALLEWPENIDISDTPPTEYVADAGPFPARRVGKDARAPRYAEELARDALRDVSSGTPKADGGHYPSWIRDVENRAVL